MMATALAQHSTVVVPCDFSVSWSISLRCGMPVPPVSSMALIVNDRLSRLAESVKFGARNEHLGNNRHDAGETKENAPEWKPYSFSSFSPSVLGRNQTKKIYDTKENQKTTLIKWNAISIQLNGKKSSSAVATAVSQCKLISGWVVLDCFHDRTRRKKHPVNTTRTPFVGW